MDAAHICLCDIAAEYFGESRQHFMAQKMLPTYLFFEEYVYSVFAFRNKTGGDQSGFPFLILVLTFACNFCRTNPIRFFGLN